MTTEYKVIYMRFKHQFDPKEIAGILDMSEADVRYILATEVNECARQRSTSFADEEKFIEIKPIHLVKEHTQRNGQLKKCVNQ